VTSRVTVSWSDYIDLSTVGASTIAIRPVGGAPLLGIYSYCFNTLSFEPDQPLAANTTYEIAISAGGVKDLMGNAVAAERIVRFSTGASIMAPPDAGPDGSSGQGGTPSGSGGSSTGGASGSSGGAGGAPGSGGTSGTGASGGQYGTGAASGGSAGAGANGGGGGQAATGGSAPNLGVPEPESPQGCGCRTRAGSASDAGLAALLALGFLLRRRRT
jgi:MYXO-CTERM domain-containing protein